MSSHVVRRRELAALAERRFVHPFNSNAVRHTRSLGDLAGLTRIGLHLVRVSPGRETTEFHVHEASDEFVYILEGQAELQLGEEVLDLAAGDFAAFPAAGPPHAMRNSGETDLVYLMGGDRPAHDVTDYPAIGKRLFKTGGRREAVSQADLVPVEGPDAST